MEGAEGGHTNTPSKALTVLEGGAGSEAHPQPHPSVDMTRDDPARIDGERRVCIASTKRGTRCPSPALKEGCYCSVHSGRMNPAAGGRAKAAKAALVREEAHALAVEAQLGTRAIVARVLTDRHDDVRRVVSGMLDDALDETLPSRERRAMRLALLPYFDQALGKPRETVEVTAPATSEEVEGMSLAELKAAHSALRAAAKSG